MQRSGAHNSVELQEMASFMQIWICARQTTYLKYSKIPRVSLRLHSFSLVSCSYRIERITLLETTASCLVRTVFEKLYFLCLPILSPRSAFSFEFPRLCCVRRNGAFSLRARSDTDPAGVKTRFTFWCRM